MVLADPLPVGRRLRNAAGYPECNQDSSKWSQNDYGACCAQTTPPVCLGYDGAMDSDEVPARPLWCRSAACMRIEAAMKASNPVECKISFTSGAQYNLLYGDILTPLDKVCDPNTTPMPTNPSIAVTSSPSAVATATPVATSKTTQPSGSSTKTKSPVTSRPDSSGATDSSEDGEATPTPSTESSSASSSSSKVPSAAAPTSVSPSRPRSSSSASSAASSSLLPLTQLPSKNQSATTASPDGPQPNASTSPSSSPTTLISGTVVSSAILFALVFIFFRRRSRRQKTQSRVKSAQSTMNATVESAPYPQGDMSDSMIQLEALKNWRIDCGELADGRLLGCGSKGAVYLVTLDGGRRLASKRLISDQLTKKRLNSVIAEIELVATLVHPSIVEFVGVAWTTPSDLQILFEYMTNGDLRTHLDQTKPPQPQPQPWTTQKLKHAVQVAEAIVYVHSFNPPVVHRDIKARNILLDDKMNAKLSDFGASRSLSEQATMTTGVGTSRWLAPEVIMGGGKYTEQCDIYSFGVLLVEMDSHAIPFADEKLPEIELLHRVATGTLRSTLSAACDPLLRELILQCLCVDPSARPNALELSYRLRKILKSFARE